jgi:hypothetical protein
MIRRLSLLGISFGLVLGCSDRTTAPNEATNATSPLAATGLSASASQQANSIPASVAWQTTAGSLAASRSLSPIVAGRAYGLVGIAQYGAAVGAAPADGEDDDSPASPRAHYYEMRGAVAGASAQVLSYLFPLDVAAIESQVANEGPSRHPVFVSSSRVGLRSAGL